MTQQKTALWLIGDQLLALQQIRETLGVSMIFTWLGPQDSDLVSKSPAALLVLYVTTPYA